MNHEDTKSPRVAKTAPLCLCGGTDLWQIYGGAKGINPVLMLDCVCNGLIEMACREVLAYPEKYREALNYGSTQGSPNLIESIRRFYTENWIGGMTEQVLRKKEIIIGPNGATSLLEGIT